jgi:hypothetical protein
VRQPMHAFVAASQNGVSPPQSPSDVHAGAHE